MELKVTKLAKIIPFNEFTEYLRELKKRKEDLWKYYLHRKLKLENTNKCTYYNDVIYKNLRDDLTEEEKFQQEKETIKLIEKYNKPVEMNYDSGYECTINVDNLIQKYRKIPHQAQRSISSKKNCIAKLANTYNENTLKSEVFELTKTSYKNKNNRESKNNSKISRSKLIEYKINCSNKNVANENKTTASTNILFTEPSKVNSSIHTCNPSNNFIEYVRKGTKLKSRKVELNIDKRLKMNIDKWNSAKNSRYYDSGNFDIPLLCLTMK
jgi:hypothetical protein